MRHMLQSAFLAMVMITTARAEPAVSVHIWSADGETIVTRGTIDEGQRATLPSDRFVIGSVAKTFLSVALLQAQEQRLVSLDDPISLWIGASILERFGDTDGLTVRHLLAMRSGLPEYLTDDFVDDWLDGHQDTKTPQRALRYAMGPMLFAPGSAYQYTNTNYLLAQLVLERATGLAMGKWFQRFIFDPAGMARTAVLGHGVGPNDIVMGREDMDGDGKQDPVSGYYTGQGFGDGGVASTAGDLVKFYQALFINKSLLTQASMEQLLTAQDGYGLGIVMEEDDPALIGHSGADVGFVADAFIDIDTNEISVILIADGEASTDAILDDIN